MKKCFNLFLFIFICIISPAQDIYKQIEQLDTCAINGDYKSAKELISKIYPASAQIKNDTILIDFLSISGSVYYTTNEFAKAGDFFKRPLQKLYKN